MCKAWDDHKKRGIQEGMQRGMQQGMQQGRLFEIYLSVQEGDYSAKEVPRRQRCRSMNLKKR